MNLEAFKAAKIDWRMAAGEKITVGVIPAGYFKNLDAVLEDFRTLTGVDVRLEMTPPGQIRQKAVLDLSSKTGTWASHAADPMYYMLYVANGWIEPIDDYLGDAKLTDNSWFKFDDIQPGHRGATSVGKRPYGIPFDGEATIQIYRKDVYDAKGLKPADTLDQYAANAKAVHDPDNRLWGCALRGFRGAGQNMYIYPSLFRAYGGEWFDGKRVVVDSPEALAALEYYVSLLNSYAPSGVENWNWPDIADAFGQGTVGSYIDAHGSAAVVANPEKSKVVGKIGFARWPKGPVGQARDLDLELELPDQRGAQHQAEAGHVAVRAMGGIARGADRDLVRFRRRLQAHRRDTATSLWNDREVPRADGQLRSQLRGSGDPSPSPRTPIRTGVRGCRSGRRSVTPWPPRSSRRWSGRRNPRRRWSKRRRESTRSSGSSRVARSGARWAASTRGSGASRCSSPRRGCSSCSLTTTFPLLYLVWSSFQTINLAMPFMDGFAGFDNYRADVARYALLARDWPDRDLHRRPA